MNWPRPPASPAPWPSRIQPVFAQPLRDEGIWKASGAPIDGRPPVLVTTFRTERDSRDRRLRLLIRPHADRGPTLITYSYAHRHGLIPTRVVPNYQQPATRYLVPDDRDFFVVYRRLPGPVAVPLR